MDKLEEGCVKSESARETITMPLLPKSLSLEEKKFLLAVERGDLANVKRMIQKAKRHGHINLNCMDPLGRGALLMAIDNENLQMVELLVVMGIETKDALLHAIDKEFVEAVELLLEHEELIHKDGEPYSWEKVDRTLASFTPDITPLILAAHRNNYEILKILLDRGANLPMPHDVRCGCVECIRGVQEDSLRHSMSRINAYRALASPSLIALSSTDPILTAFELSVELKNLAYAETEFRQEYMNLRGQCQDFAVELLGHTRSSQELAILLNHDPASPPYEDGDHMKLARLELAIDYKQKKFVAHPNIQQLLGAIWYEGLPGFRRKSLVQKLTEISKIALLFPLYCLLYMVAPSTQMGQLMRKPFMKFLIHASSYLFFLFLLILVSQRFEVLVVQLLGTTSMKRALEDQLRKQRGNGPTYLECIVVIYVLGYICEDVKELWKEGLSKYVRNMWNFIELFRNMAYLLVIVFRVVAYIQQQQEIALNPATAYIPREEWDDFDPQLIAEGIFAMANIFSAVKLVHLFSINPYLGPLQISLGRMVIDIVKFFFIYSLVLFAFACGLNQLLWYFSDLERQKCYSLPGGLPDWNKNPDACLKWRRFANLFESSQSLFWASFGLVDLTNFELTGVKTYTRFWGMLMFGSYSVINVVVLLNLLIAMMSNSYSLITEHSDTEWKFARSKLWMSYFEEGGTLPPPFNLFPTPKDFSRVLGLRNKDKLRQMSSKRKQSKQRERDYRYSSVMRALVWRFITMMHRKQEMSEVTEDDVNEVKGDISSLRFELLDVFKANGMDISAASKTTKAVLGRKMRVWERRLLRDFHVVSVAGEDPNGDGTAAERSHDTDENDPGEKFRRLAMMVISKNASGAAGSSKREIKPMSQIGRSLSSDSFQSSQNLRKAMEEAKRLAVMEPTPEGSLRGSPLPNIDTGASVLELLQNIAEEEKQQQQDPGTDPKKEPEKLLLPWKPTKNENKNTKPKTIPKPRPPLPKEASTESKDKEIKPTIKLEESQKVKDQSGATKESPEVNQGTEKPKEVSQLVIKNEQSVEQATETKKEDKRVPKRSAPVAPAVVPGAGPSAPESTIPPSLSAEKVDTKKAASPGSPGPSTPDSTPSASTPGSSAPASTISPPAGPTVATPSAEIVEIKISAIPGLAACSSTPDSTACLMPERADIKISISPEPTAAIDLVAMETDVPFKVPEFVSTQLPIAANAEEEKVAFSASAVDEIPKPVKKCENPTEVKSDENKTAPDTTLIPPKSVTDVKTIKRDPRSGWL